MMKIEKLICTARQANLDGRGILLKYTPDELTKIYNGIGPERWWNWLRILITWRYNLFEPAALIHDVRFEDADGSREKFEHANGEFNLNCQKLINLHHPSGGLTAARWRSKAKKAALALKMGSFSAWQEAAKK